MHRFFVRDTEFQENSRISIKDASEIHHIRTVLRLKPGSEIRVFDGQGAEAEGNIVSLNEMEIQVRIKNILPATKTSNLPFVTLACAIPKKAKFKDIIEKCTELGIDEIIPLKTQRTEAAPKPEKIKNKANRFQTIAINAAKQCQRTTLPLIRSITDYTDYLKNLDTEQPCLIFHLNAQTGTLPEILSDLSSPSTLTFLIGPEGDFTENEIAMAIESGCRPASLGPTTLKVDTAAIAAVAYANLYFRR